MSCAEMAERIDLPFGLWNLVGLRKHKFNRFYQVVPCQVFVHVGGHIGSTWQIQLNRPSAAMMQSYVK